MANDVPHMPAITLHQPWASLIACGEKRLESRSWPIAYRGQIAVHAAAKVPSYARALMEKDPRFVEALDRHHLAHDPRELPAGAVLAVAEIVGCHKVEAVGCSRSRDEADSWHVRYRYVEELVPIEEQELVFGNIAPHRWVWELQNVRAIEPVPAKGQQGIWTWIYTEEEVEPLIERTP